ACEHVLTRSVRDSAALLDVAAGAHPGDPVVAPRHGVPYAALLSGPPGRRLRIGHMHRAPAGAAPLDPECRNAVREAAGFLGRLGHQVVHGHPAAHGGLVAGHAVLRVVAAWLALDVDERSRAVGRPPREGEIEPHNEVLLGMARALRATDYLAAQVYLQGWA